MKTFRVTKKSASGKPEEIILEAEDRNALFAELQKHCISAIKVDEASGALGGARVRKATVAKGGRGVSGAFIGIVAAFIAIVIAAAVWIAVQSGDDGKDTGKPDKKTGAISEVAPSAPSAPRADEPPAVDEEALERERRRAAYKAMTPEERWEFVVERARNSPLREEPGTNRIFRTSTEQVMDWIFSCEVGDPPPLLPNLPLKEQLHLAEILALDNPIYDDDTERAKEAKETVKLVKKEFQDFIKEGGEPEEFLPYYHSQLVQAHEEWKTARKMIMDAIKEDPDIAADFISKVNERLAEKGIKQVTLPQRMLDHYGIELVD